MGKQSGISQTRAETAVGQLIFDYELRMAGLGMNFAELARRLGVSRARVSGLMSGRQNPTIGSLMKIAEIMGCYLRIELAPLELPAADAASGSAENAPSGDITYNGAEKSLAGSGNHGRRRKSPTLRVAAKPKVSRKARWTRDIA